MTRLGSYMLSGDETFKEIKELARLKNAWFSEEHIELAVHNIATHFLQPTLLLDWTKAYTLPAKPKTIGIVMAGNIPLVGFHDFLCGYLSGHRLLIKLSSKDEMLLKHMFEKCTEWDENFNEQVEIADRLNGCDAYIATGSNNTARYFEQYFGKYPHIIRKNRTSVAVLDGTETEEDLSALADDIFQYYGLGCRNVTQVCVPQGYDFLPLLKACRKYDHYADFHKYKNNLDYHLAIYLLNRVPYMSNEALLMVENELPFSAVSVLHYRYYDNKQQLLASLQTREDIQAILGKGFLPFGKSQQPGLMDYADGVDTMAFLCGV